MSGTAEIAALNINRHSELIKDRFILSNKAASSLAEDGCGFASLYRSCWTDFV